MRICMIGVGLMGHGIAKNILRAGPYHLSFLHHDGNQPIDDLLAAGAVQSETLSMICPNADIILLCVTGAPEVETVLFSEQGVLTQDYENKSSKRVQNGYKLIYFKCKR